MKNLKKLFHRAGQKIKNDQAKGAQKAMLEELFNDYYINRRKVYRMNFFRGVFFSLGSILGGTILVAMLLWVLSWFVNIPVIGNYFEQAQETIDNR